MSYTPVELRHVRVGRRPFGYHRASVEQILTDVADSFETVWRDRGELSDKVEALEQELATAKEREQLLTNTLVAAEHAAEEMRERARREAELIVSEAHAEARSVMHAGQGERERLLAEVRRIEALLRSALAVVGEAGASSEPSAAPTVVAQAPAVPKPKQEEPRDLRSLVAASAEAPDEPEAAPAQPEPTAEQAPVVADDDLPGWPPLRKVAQGGADFEWGD
jgi:cell division initiation protein